MIHARKQNGLTIYVHPTGAEKPFDNSNIDPVPHNLIPDVLLGNVDTLEIACTVSNELGSCDLWYRFLSIVIPLMPSAGSDTFPNFYRNKLFDSTRIYVKSRVVLPGKNSLFH